VARVLLCTRQDIGLAHRIAEEDGLMFTDSGQEVRLGAGAYPNHELVFFGTIYDLQVMRPISLNNPETNVDPLRELVLELFFHLGWSYHDNTESFTHALAY